MTVSDTRTPATDASGDAIVRLAGEAGHRVGGRRIVRDEPEEIARAVRELAAQPGIDAIVTTGGTGLSGRDRTYESVTALHERRLDGFGELFRALSFAEIGPAAMLSRAVAGVVGGRIVFSLPGSEPAVRLALTRLILPVLPHVVEELRRDSPPRGA